jgi:HlyD family secretion protein
MNKKGLFIGCSIPLILVGGGIFWAVKSFKPKPKPTLSETVQKGIVEIKVVENGTIEPLRKVEVKSKVGGRVLKLLVDEGAVVKKGQPLAYIDPQEINTQIAALKAQMAGAVARLSAAKKGTIFQRDTTSTSIQQFEQAMQAARARLKSAEIESTTQPELTQKGIEIAEANLEAARANQRVQEANLRLLQENTHPQAIVNAQAGYDRAGAQLRNQERNLERQKQLLQKGFVAQQLVDNAETDVRVAEAQMREAKQRLDRINQQNSLEVTNAQSQIANAKSQVRQMEAALSQAKANTLPLTRKQDLMNSRASLAQIEAQYAAAKAGRTQDKMRGDDVLAAQAQVSQIKSQLDELLVRQNDTTLLASMDGVITKRYVEQGELITSAISSFSSGTPVFQIADLGVMLVKINVNEVDIGKLKPGTLTEVTIDASKGAKFPGKVRKIAPASLTAGTTGDSGSRNSGASVNTGQVVRFLIEIQIDRPDPILKPGMSARCAVIVARHSDVLRLPTNCVSGEGENAKVQVVTETKEGNETKETATERKVKTGLKGDDFIEIVEGLKEGEKIRPNPFTGPERKTIDIQGP